MSQPDDRPIGASCAAARARALSMEFRLAAVRTSGRTLARRALEPSPATPRPRPLFRNPRVVWWLLVLLAMHGALLLSP